MVKWLEFERWDIPTPTFTQKTEISLAYFFPRKKTELCATVAACSQVQEHFGGYGRGEMYKCECKSKVNLPVEALHSTYCET